MCYAALSEAERKIEILAGFDAAGNPVTHPFDEAATAGEANVARRNRPLTRSAAPSPETRPANAGEGSSESGGTGSVVDDRRELF